MEKTEQKNVIIGQRLKEERKRIKFKQEELANLLNVTRGTLFTYETGKSAPDANQLALLIQHGFDINYVLTGTRRYEINAQNTYSPILSHTMKVSEREKFLIESYRKSDEEGRQMIEKISYAVSLTRMYV